MMRTPARMDPRRAREVLGVSLFHSAADLRRAFREAAKRAHPDRPGGDAEQFREAVEAFQVLQHFKPTASRARRVSIQESAATPPTPMILPISTAIAMSGGPVEHRLSGGRLVRIDLPPGMRDGDRVRAAGHEFTVAIATEDGVQVRGGDLWLDVKVDRRLLADGGRVSLDTPLGRRVVWITRKAGERGLVRLVGQGLPSRGPWQAGHLYLRLTPAAGTTDSAARTLLRRFAAAWAA